jgi:hypothetical protein
MTEDHAWGDVFDRSPSGQLFLRVGNGVVMRSDRGTWLIDLKIPSKGGHHHLQVPIGKHRAIDRLAHELRRGDESP